MLDVWFVHDATWTTIKTINKIFLRLIRHNFVCRAARRRQPNTVFLAKCQKLHHRSLLQQQQLCWDKIIFEVQFKYFIPVSFILRRSNLAAELHILGFRGTPMCGVTIFGKLVTLLCEETINSICKCFGFFSTRICV